MKCFSSLLLAAAAASALRADDAALLTTSAVDAGGGFSSGDAVEIIGSLGGFGGVSDDTEQTTAARAGFTGQIYDPARVEITPGTAELTENVIVDFTGQVVCDDDSILAGELIEWSVDTPLLHVSADGRVGAGLFPGSLTANLTAAAAGVSGTALLNLTDTNPDNFGDFAGDGLPDDWQIHYFGSDAKPAAPKEDPDGDGQDNHTEHLAGTDPTDPESLFRLAFSGDHPIGSRVLEFSPYLPGRRYILEVSSDLADGWTESPGKATAAPTPGHGIIPDENSEEQRSLYRMQIRPD